MGKNAKRTLVRAGIVREFIFADAEALVEYLNTIRGPFEARTIESYKDGRIRAAIISCYNSNELYKNL